MINIVEPAFERHIPTVVFEAPCKRHNSLKGEPCFHVRSTIAPGVVYFGVCNTRAKKAGMVGKIDPRSLSRSLRNG